MESQKVRDQIHTIVQKIPRPPTAKCGRFIQDIIAAELNSLGEFDAKKEDPIQFLRGRMPVWRNKKDGTIESTINRRKIDIVVYKQTAPIALIEIESDLNDLRPSGITNRNGHYDVFSIGKSAKGQHFHSYKSLERMAAAAFYHNSLGLNSHDPEANFAEFAVDRLINVQSDEPKFHNPAFLPMFLVVGKYREADRVILQPRLNSLGAELLSILSP